MSSTAVEASPMQFPQPYLNADLYRNHVVNNSYRHADFMDIAADGVSILGRSDLTGRVWNGIVQVADSPEKFTNNVEKKKPYPDIIASNGISDGCFLGDSSKILISDDAGDISIWAKQTSWSAVTKNEDQQDAWSPSCSACEHDNGIMAVDVFSSNEKIVSGGADNCIKVWDLNLVSLETYRPAHTNIVSDVACSKSSETFLSASLDGYVALWDIGCPGSKAKVLAKATSAVRSVCWLSEKRFVAGCDSGEIMYYDISSPNTAVCTTSVNFPVHRIIYHERSKLMAVCGDSNIMKVFKVTDSSDFQIIYEDNRHTEFVRGMAWKNSEITDLFSCGWDGIVLKHAIKM